MENNENRIPAPEEMKMLLLNKLAELIQMIETHGSINEDGQSLFIAQTLGVVLAASMNPNSASLLDKYIKNFLEEYMLMVGKTTFKDYVLNNNMASAN